MLTNEMAATGSFKMVERANLEPVMREQDLVDYGRIRPGTGAEIGKLTGAQYLVMGTVSAYEENVKGTGGGIGFRGIRVGGKKEQAYLASGRQGGQRRAVEVGLLREPEHLREDPGRQSHPGRADRVCRLPRVCDGETGFLHGGVRRQGGVAAREDQEVDQARLTRRSAIHNGPRSQLAIAGRWSSSANRSLKRPRLLLQPLRSGR